MWGVFAGGTRGGGGCLDLDTLCGVDVAQSHRYNTNNRKPYHGVNFVVCHDGFTLYDLVSYNSKHNDANGEQGRDGSNDNFSWNCGAEGETEDEGINVRPGRNSPSSSQSALRCRSVCP